jgi:hypothetical protein
LVIFYDYLLLGVVIFYAYLPEAWGKGREKTRGKRECLSKGVRTKEKTVDLFPQLVYPVHLDTLNPDWTKLHGWSRSHQGDGWALKSDVFGKAFSCKKGGDDKLDALLFADFTFLQQRVHFQKHWKGGIF